jgi:Zn-dependent peptidase ImmA (M78 family)
VAGPEFVELNCDGLIEPLGKTFADGFRIKLNKTTPPVRSRFTLVHEICHTFFYQLVPEIKVPAPLAG